MGWMDGTSPITFHPITHTHIYKHVNNPPKYTLTYIHTKKTAQDLPQRAGARHHRPEPLPQARRRVAQALLPRAAEGKPVLLILLHICVYVRMYVSG